LSSHQKIFLTLLANIFEKIDWKPDAIHNAIYEVIAEEKKMGNTQAGFDGFKTLYQVLLGKIKGPRAGYFLSTLEKDFVIQRFREAAQ
jgi:lysyl-tRNA synthetase class 1